MNDLNVKVMLSIPETSQRTGLTMLSLRTLCKQGKIDYVTSGRKYLINYPKLLEKLNSGELKEV